MYRNTRYKSEQSFLMASSNSNQPIRLRPRWSKGPCQKLNTVVKPKIPAIILNVVIAQKLVKFLRLSWIIHIHITPFVRLGQGIAILLYFFQCLDLNLSVKSLGNLFKYPHNRLSGPKLVLFEEWKYFGNDSSGSALIIKTIHDLSKQICYFWRALLWIFKSFIKQRKFQLIKVCLFKLFFDRISELLGGTMHENGFRATFSLRQLRCRVLRFLNHCSINLFR